MSSSKIIRKTKIYTTLALFLLLLSSNYNRSPNSQHHHRHRRLKLRPVISNYSSAPPPSPIPFDPLISDSQLHRDDRLWERSHFHFDESSDPDNAPGHVAQPQWEDFMDAEDYVYDDERFNVTNRIESLFPSVDVDPPTAASPPPSWRSGMSSRPARGCCTGRGGRWSSTTRTRTGLSLSTSTSPPIGRIGGASKAESHGVMAIRFMWGGGATSTSMLRIWMGMAFLI